MSAWAPWAPRLRALRAARGMTGETLGALSGVTRSAVHRYESAVSTPSFDVLMGMLDALDTTPGEFFATRPAASSAT